MNVKRPVAIRHLRGFTLVEMLVAIGIVGLLIALLLPAVQAAREAAHRAQCSSNMRQLGIGISFYEGVFGSYPAGRVPSSDGRYIDGKLPCSPWIVDKSFLVRILPNIEQSVLYNSINNSLSIFSAENSTVHSNVIGTFVCPSDTPSGTTRSGYPLSKLRIPDTKNGEPSPLASSSYAGIHSAGVTTALPEPTPQGCSVPSDRAARANGCLTDFWTVTTASISDGTSHTLLMSEKAVSLLGSLDSIEQTDNYSTSGGWWFSGDWGDTLISCYFPPNAHSTLPHSLQHSWLWSASSMHPAGVNGLLADGSVKFIKNSISARHFDLTTGVPAGPAGVWQALGTRNGAETSDGEF